MEERKFKDEDIFKNFEVVIKVRNELNKESDRGACLMAASYLENELELLLLNKIVGSNNSKKELFKFNGPLGTFSAKIKMSFSIGLISKENLNDLETIRRIRNIFGHSFDAITFETDILKKEVHKLKSHYYFEKEVTSRSMFLNTFTAVLAEIHSAEFVIIPFVERTKSILQDQKIERRKEIEELIPKLIKMLAGQNKE